MINKKQKSIEKEKAEIIHNGDKYFLVSDSLD